MCAFSLALIAWSVRGLPQLAAWLKAEQSEKTSTATVAPSADEVARRVALRSRVINRIWVSVEFEVSSGVRDRFCVKYPEVCSYLADRGSQLSPSDGAPPE